MGKIILVLGGSGSGKSDFAESLLNGTEKNKYYIATMRSYGGGDIEKIDKHRQSRIGKHFTDLEWDKYFYPQSLPAGSSVLIECMGTFCANWYFDEGDCLAQIQNELWKVFKKADKTVIVSNDVFFDGEDYLPETMAYMKVLGNLNRWIGCQADCVAEVVCGIPIVHKGGTEC